VTMKIHFYPHIVEGVEYRLNARLYDHYRYEPKLRVWRDLETGRFVSFTNIRKASAMYTYWDHIRIIQSYNPTHSSSYVREMMNYGKAIENADERDEFFARLWGTPE